jgi:photosystem II stability/assembly factor-like uncharacterized protein
MPISVATKKLLIGAAALTIMASFAAPTATQTKAKAAAAKQSDPLAALSLDAFRLRAIGPALTSGRVSDLAVRRGKRQEFYVAAASGGVWKTVNAGTTFTPVFDSEGSHSIGCITIDPRDPNIVWVGTGENGNQRCVTYGDGVYKSEDAGASWTNVGLRDSEHIGMIVVDPRDSNVVYVAAYGPLWRSGGERGLYKTTDGGRTWTAVLTIDPDTGVCEVHLDPRDPDVVYASAHQRRRHVFTQVGGGPGSGIYKSTDAGKTWKKIVKGLPGGDLGRIGLALSPVVPNLIYAIVDAQENRGGFYRSLNGGASWERRSGYFSSGNYYQEIFCDPKDPQRVYTMDIVLGVTDDGGATWKPLGSEDKHPDSHAFWVDPDDTDYYLDGNDGGVYESFDRGLTWKFMSNLPLTQFYKVDVDNGLPFYSVYGGTQDNGSLGGPSRTTGRGIVNSDWYRTQGSDGFESAADPEDPDIVYAQAQYGDLVRFDKKSGEATGIQPKPRRGEAEYRWNWDAPLFVSPHSHTRLYIAANKVFRSDDRGDSWTVISDDLTRRLDRNTLEVMGRVWPMNAVAKSLNTSPYGNIVALDESPVAEGLLYAGTDDGLIQVTEDGGAAWRRIDSFPGIPDMTYVSDIIASRHDRNTVYAAFDNHKRGDFKPYILKSVDLGGTWTSIASDLPERGSVYSLAEDDVRKDLLFAGTEFGLFVTLDGGRHWRKLSSGLPPQTVRDLAIQRRENDLVLATFGRGIYILDDYSALRDINPRVLAEEGHLFPVKDAWMFTPSASRPGDQGGSFFSAPNPPVAAVFTYYLKDAPKSLRARRLEAEAALIKAGKAVTYPTYEELKSEESEEPAILLFTIADENGRVVRVVEEPARRGINRVTWDLKYPALGPFYPPQTGPILSRPSSAFVIPGAYTVSMALKHGGKVKPLAGPVPFKVRALASVSLPAADRAELAAFQGRVSRLSNSANGAAHTLTELLALAGSYRTALRSVTVPHEDILDSIEALETRLEELQLRLTGDWRLFRWRLSEPSRPAIIARLDGIISSQSRSSSAPTKTDREQFAIAEEELKPVYEEIGRILTEQVRTIEKRLDSVGAPYTPCRLTDWK